MKQVKKDGIEAKKDYLIVNFGSVASTNGMYGMVHYSASKGAVLAMTLPIARDLGKFGVRIVCILPGFFNTPMGRSIPDKYKKYLRLSSQKCNIFCFLFLLGFIT